MKSGLITFITLAVTLRTDDAGCKTLDTGRMTLSPTTPYYKLTGELKIAGPITRLRVFSNQFGLRVLDLTNILGILYK